MMPAVNDVQYVHWLIERTAGRFAYLADAGLWIRKEGEEWQAFAGRGEVLSEYVNMMAEAEEVTPAQRIMATWGTAQSRVLDMLERDPRLSKRLTDFPPHSLRHFCRTPLNPGAASDPTLLLNRTFRTFCGAYFPDNPDVLATFCHRAFFGAAPAGLPNSIHAHEKYTRLFLRSVSQAENPDPLFDLLAAFFGELVCRLPRSVWTKWPDALTPAWAYRLYGVRMLFLDGCERPREFAPQSLQRLVCRETADWVGRDRLIYSLPLPEYFVLTGPPVNVEELDDSLKALVLEARPIWTHRRGQGEQGEADNG